MPQSTRKPATPNKTIRRKNINIDQAELDQVRSLLDARSETEAVDQALSIVLLLVLLREEVVRGVQRVVGSGGVENYFAA